MQTILAATTNQGKLKEIKSILESLKVRIIDPTEIDHPLPTVVESGTSFAENALIKARAYSLSSNLPTVSDDSGLMVTALNGQPGVYSARFAKTDHERNLKLLKLMEGVALEERGAQFVCVAAYCDAASQIEQVFTGTVDGLITESLVGEAGFGYDPVFFYKPLQKTFAEITGEQKNAISHRRQAFQQLAQWLHIQN